MFQMSPGIDINEIDLTNVVPAVSSTEGAIAGMFQWGPINETVLISSENDLVRTFGKPKTGFNIETFFTAADFLAYGNALYVVRVSDGLTASTVNTAISAKYPGAMGNSLSVIFLDSTTYATSDYASFFSGAPGLNELHVVVVDEDGVFGQAGAVLELYSYLSIVDGTLRPDGANNYIVDVIENTSNFFKLDANSLDLEITLVGAEYDLTGGTNGSTESVDEAYALVTAGYDLFKSADDVSVSLILQGKAISADMSAVTPKTQLANYIKDNIVEFRKDCMVFISPGYDSVIEASGATEITDNIIEFRDDVTNSSYAVMDTGYKYRYDRYNDRFAYTPLNGDIAGLCVRTDDIRDPWFSPAGYNRGLIRNSVKLPYNPNKTMRDRLYQKDVNPVITESGRGTLLFGDKTLLGNASAFDRINVRRLFIVLQKAIGRAAKLMLFEFNDEFTRAQFVNLIEPYLRDVQGRRGIFDFRVVADETNNTPEVIDRNEFVASIYIKPARSINTITLNFVAVRTGIEFEEVSGRF